MLVCLICCMCKQNKKQSRFSNDSIRSTTKKIVVFNKQMIHSIWSVFIIFIFILVKNEWHWFLWKHSHSFAPPDTPIISALNMVWMFRCHTVLEFSQFTQTTYKLNHIRLLCCTNQSKSMEECKVKIKFQINRRASGSCFSLIWAKLYDLLIVMKSK